MDWAEIYKQIIRFTPRWEIINADEVGVQLHFGKIRRSLEPGVYFCLPYFDEIFTITSVPQVVTIPHQSVVSKDGKTFALTFAATYSVADAEQAIMGIDDIDEQIRCFLADMASHYINSTCGLRINVDGLSEYVQKEAEGYLYEDMGVNLESVNIYDLAPHKIIRLMSGTHIQPEE